MFTPTTLRVVNAFIPHVFDARFLTDNWELLIGGCAIGQVLVAYCLGTSFIVPIYAYKLVFVYFLFERRWVVNPETHSVEWVVNYKSCVVNYTWYKYSNRHNFGTKQL